MDRQLTKQQHFLRAIRALTAFIVIVFLLSACGERSAAPAATATAPPSATPTSTTTQPTPTLTPASSPTAAVSPTVEATAEAYLALLDTVWQTVNDNYFDPDFGSVDWAAVREHYEPLVAAAQNDEEFYLLLNQMLWELEVSHAAVGPVAMWPSVEPMIWLPGTTGLDVRLLEGQAVVTRVEAGSPAEEAGLRAGFLLERMDGAPVAQILAEAETEQAPPYTESGRIDHLTRALLARLYGTPGSCVALVWLDQEDQQHEACVQRLQRERPAEIEGLPLPPSYLEFEARRLPEGSGYIRFNTFHPELIPELVAAVQALRDAPGIIVDLRGNPGGSLGPAEALAAQFLTEPAVLGSINSRAGSFEWVIEPAEEPYEGPLVILLDRLSFSGSEWFSASMQAPGRAVVIGLPSPGGVTGANIAELSNGALLMYPVIELVMPDGTSPEGRGVIPDLEVALEREQLLEGTDAQLEAALDYIEGQNN